MITKRVTMSVILCLILVTAISFVAWRSLSSNPAITTSGSDNATFVGISTETSGSLTSNDRNNLFWTAEAGLGGVAFSTAPTYFPSLIRIEEGFATPDEDSIFVVNEQLQEKAHFPISGLGIGTQIASAGSPNFHHGAFLFNIGDSSNPNRVKVVAISTNGTRSTDRDKHASALTACDNGTIKWLEFLPNDINNVDGEGTATLVSWSTSGTIEATVIPWSFFTEPGPENHLSCDSSPATIVSEDKNGNPISIQLEYRDGIPSVRNQLPLPPTQPPAMSRFSSIINDTLYSLDKQNTLSAVNIKTGALVYRQSLMIDGPSPVSITFENSHAFLVFRPNNLHNKQAVLPIDLERPNCTGPITPLVGYDESSQKSKLERLGDSFKVATAVLPKSSSFSFNCT